MSGTLSIVATPIGNLADITYRAVEILRMSDVIVCEDTRVTGKLCAHYDIDVQRTALHHHSPQGKIDKIVERLQGGENIAYVSDAGTPGVSDPGNQLVAAATAAGVCVTPIPGASALSAVISVAGIDMQRFTFLAYPPHKKGRHTFFDVVAASDIPVVYYDSVHRIVKNLTLLQEKKTDAQVVVGRELTKMFEEVRYGNVSEVLTYFIDHGEKVKGEFVVIVYT